MDKRDKSRHSGSAHYTRITVHCFHWLELSSNLWLHFDFHTLFFAYFSSCLPLYGNVHFICHSICRLFLSNFILKWPHLNFKSFMRCARMTAPSGHDRWKRTCRLRISIFSFCSLNRHTTFNGHFCARQCSPTSIACVCDHVLYYLLIYSSMPSQCSALSAASLPIWTYTLTGVLLLELVIRPYNGHYVHNPYSLNSFIFYWNVVTLKSCDISF